MGPLIRRADWPEILHARLDLARRTPFAWGRGWDCVTFPLCTADALCDSALAAPFLGAYDTAAGALRAIVDYGGAELDQAADRLAAEWGLPEIRARGLRRGDLALVDAAFTDIGQPIGAICAGARLAVMTARGLAYLPLAAARRAWRVG